MPNHTSGPYTASITNAQGTYVDCEPVTFSYIQLKGFFRVLVGLFGVFCLTVVCVFAIPKLLADRAYSPFRYAILVPGVVGLVLALWCRNTSVLCYIPLQVLTLTFLEWRRWNLGEWTTASITPLYISLLTALLNLQLIPATQGLVGIPAGILVGGLTAFSIIALRIAIREQVTWPRLLAGLAIGAGLPCAGALFILILYGIIAGSAPPFAVCVSIPIFFGLPVLLFIGFVCGNTWAEDVATGSILRTHSWTKL